ncbi:flagellar basal body P-ring formation protein FlgA [bacterium]|nr:flagellar basal body P-ring formation protein FlgA [bacterium]
MNRNNGQQGRDKRPGLRSLLALLLAVVFSTPALAAPAVSIELIDGAAVAGNVFTLGDIARLASGDGELWRQLAAEPLGYAPAPGENVTLAADTILGRLAERGYDWRAIALSGPAVLTICGTTQLIESEPLLAALMQAVEDELGVSAQFNVTRPLPVVTAAAGELDIEVRFPDKPGWWLPDAVEISVNGLQVQRILLAQHGEFELPVVVAPAGIAGRTVINGAHLGTELSTVRPGHEVVTQPGQVIGLTTRGQIAAGAPVLFSRLMVPYDVERGSEVALVIRGGVVELTALAVALNNAYIGQRLTVKRLDDGMKFTGRVEAGPRVVVE